MNTKKIVGIFLLSLCTMCFVNCSDDDTPEDPADTITLNMLNEHNGKTYLGESNVYIYNPQIEMFARFKTKSSFHKTKRII